MRINYVLNENKEIISWSSIPFDPSKPHITIPDGVKIYLNCSQIVGGRFIQNQEKHNRQQQKAEALMQKELAIIGWKEYLASTDYIVIKEYEGLMESESDKIKAQEIKTKRAEARAKIKKLEHDIENHNY